MLAGSNAWSAADDEGLADWFAAISATGCAPARKAKDEDAAKNNHGTWYDVQVTDIALFLGDTQVGNRHARAREDAAHRRADRARRAQPLELARTNAWGYSNRNLDALCRLATFGDKVGVDLWNFKTADGRSIRAAIDFLVPYAAGEKKWDYQQIGGFHANAMVPTFLRAASAYHDRKVRSPGATNWHRQKNDVEIFAAPRRTTAYTETVQFLLGLLLREPLVGCASRANRRMSSRLAPAGLDNDVAARDIPACPAAIRSCDARRSRSPSASIRLCRSGLPSAPSRSQ